MAKPNHSAGETVLEKIAGSTKLDGWASLIACAIVLAQLIGLINGVDLLRSIPLELVIGVFGAIAAARRKLANGRGVRERSIEDLPIPKAVRDEITRPITLPPHLIEVDLAEPESVVETDDGEGQGQA